jgi:hypothetical protein
LLRKFEDLRFDFDDAAVFPDDEGEAEFAVFGADGFVNAAEGAFGGFDHRGFANGRFTDSYFFNCHDRMLGRKEKTKSFIHE